VAAAPLLPERALQTALSDGAMLPTTSSSSAGAGTGAGGSGAGSGAEEQQWWAFDDSQCWPVESLPRLLKTVGSAGYLLVYQREPTVTGAPTVIAGDRGQRRGSAVSASL